MTVYTRPRATAERLLAKWGAACTLTRTVPGVYDPATGLNAASTVTVYTGTAFRENYALKDIDGTLVRRGDVRFLFSPLQTNGADLPEPAPDTDVITFASKAYQVIAVDPYDFSGEAVAFYVQARA